MIDRRRALWLLLETRDDWVPSPRVGSPRGATPGPAASRYVPCETCGHTGRVTRRGGWRLDPCQVCRDHGREACPECTVQHRRPVLLRECRHLRALQRHGCQPCLTCRGTGVVEATRRRLDEDPWEAYSGLPLAELHRQIDEARLEEAQRQTQRRTTGSQQGDELPWAAAHRRWEAAGGYRALDVALERLATVAPAAHGVLQHWLSMRSCADWAPSDGFMAAVNTGVDRLLELMPERIRVPRWVAKREEHAA